MSSSIKDFFRDVFIKVGKILRSVLMYFFVFMIVMAVLSSLGGVLIGLGQKEDLEGSGEKVIYDQGGEDKILFVKLSGIILPEASANLFSPTTEIITPAKIRDVLLNVKKDPLIKGIIFQINSPGGSPVASDQIFELIVQFRQDTGIPVVFRMSDLAASGGYYISSAADFIVANPATMTGSIGVIMETYNLQELYEKIGVSKVTIKQGKYKDILNDSREMTEEEEGILDKISADAYDLFVKKVAQGRNMDEEIVRELATGQIYSGKQALELGLVDSLGNLDEAIYQTKNLAGLDHYKVIEKQSNSLFSQLLGEVNSKVNLFNVMGATSTTRLR